MNKELKYYLKIYYPTLTRQYNDDGKRKYLVEYPDLPGCSSHGETPGKAYAMAEKAKKLWIETCIKEGIQIPEPRSIEEYSGRFVLRPSKSLHYELSNLAKKENTSLNQCALQLIAKGLGKKEAENDYKKEMHELKSTLKNIEDRLEKYESEATQGGIQETLDVRLERAISYVGLTNISLLGEKTNKIWQQPTTHWGVIRKAEQQVQEKTLDTSNIINIREKTKKRKEVNTE